MNTKLPKLHEKNVKKRKQQTTDVKKIKFEVTS